MAWTGSAPNQTYQRTDGTRTGSQVWQQADAASVDIISSDHDTHDQDFADALSSCIKKDGGNQATANLPMGGFGHTNVAAASASTMYARASDVQNNRLSYCTVGGTANAITLTNTLVISAYATGQEFRFTASYTNTSSVTIAVDGLAATAVTVAGVALSAGQIVAGAWVTVAYNGTNFELVVGTTPASVSVGTVMAWPISTVPTGWLECDGSAVSRTTYSALFAILSTKYGVGDGSTTFNLPNYSDYFLRGFDASGTDASSRTDRGDGTTGANVGTKQASDYLSHTHTGTTSSNGAHTHTVDVPTVPNESSSGNNPADAAGSTSTTYQYTTSSNGAHTHTFTTAAAPTSGGTETRPKNITVKWIILALPSAALSTAQIAPYITAVVTDRSGTDVNTAQNVFATGYSSITLPASTGYLFDAIYYITRAAGSTSHTTSVLFGGTATFTSIMYVIESTTTTGAPTATTASQQLVATAATATVAATTSTSTTENIVIKLKGVMRINASGTVIPQFQYSAAPGGAPTIKANSFFSLTPIGSDTVASSGPWA